MSTTSPILTFAIRGTQALFAIVVFGLSTSLIKGHHLGSLPSTLGFVAFVGGLSFVGAILGFAAHWLVVLQGQIGVLVDAVVAGINIAGGVVSLMSSASTMEDADDAQLMAIQLAGVKCEAVTIQDRYNTDTNVWHMVTNNIICGGYRRIKDDDDEEGFYCFYLVEKTVGTLLSRCQMSKADSAFMFLTATVVSVAAVLGFLRMKRGY